MFNYFISKIINEDDGLFSLDTYPIRFDKPKTKLADRADKISKDLENRTRDNVKHNALKNMLEQMKHINIQKYKFVMHKKIFRGNEEIRNFTPPKYKVVDINEGIEELFKGNSL